MYKQTEPFTCGPSSYIEEFEIIKNRKKEMEYHEMGRIKPSRIFLGASFLELNKNLQMYITSKKLSKGVMQLTYNPNIDNFEDKIKNYYSSLIKKHKKNIFILKDNADSILELLDQFIRKRKKILFLSDSSYWSKKGMLHWITIKDLDKNLNYLCGDPDSGTILTFSKQDLVRQMLLVKSKNFNIQFVTN